MKQKQWVSSVRRVRLVWTMLGLACSGALVSTTALAQQVIVVRHAERAADKPDDKPGDPGLSRAGTERAAALAQALRGTRVTAIFTSDTRRTSETAAVVAAETGVKPVMVPVVRGKLPEHITAVADAARSVADGVVLVVGHSNTVPLIVKALSGRDVVTICEHHFSHIFVVTPNKGQVIAARYGVPDADASADCKPH